MNEFDKWAKSEEQRELPQVQEIKRSLADLGATAEHEQPLSVFAEKLNNPVTDKNRKIYVEVPAPKVLIPLTAIPVCMFMAALYVEPVRNRRFVVMMEKLLIVLNIIIAKQYIPANRSRFR